MNKTADALIAKCERRDAVFGVVGLGYVGLPLAVELARAGYHVLGYDVNPRVVDGLNAGRSHVKDVTDAQLAEVRGRFSATSDAARLSEPDAISICVPTPLSKFKDPDVSFIVAATEAVKQVFSQFQSGKVFVQQGQYASAEKAFTNCLNVDPEKPVPVDKILKHFEKFGDYKQLAVHYIWEDLWWKRKNENIPWLEKEIRI